MAGTAASGDLDPAPSLDALLSNQQHDSERNNNGKRKTESQVGAAAEPSHPERTTGTAASGDLVFAPRLGASLTNQQHGSERHIEHNPHAFERMMHMTPTVRKLSPRSAKSTKAASADHKLLLL
jgi:hypothetical protein